MLIEDAAESLGSYYKGKHAGTLGEYGAIRSMVISLLP
ncbi:MAG: DegT/DnrJ/EryC1/StrS family aminotransferase [Colwellia sp.]